MDFIRACVANPVKVAVGVLLVALFGLIALDRLPVQLTPEVQRPAITIETRWPGASPVEVEREIVQEQEEQLKSVEGISDMDSECQDSTGRITLEFGVGTNMTEALLRVNAQLQQVAEYPTTAEEPVITASSSSDNPIAWFILRPKVVSKADIEAFAALHPELSDPLAPVLRAASTGLRLARLRGVVEEHPKAAALLPPAIDVTRLRRFAEDNIEARFEQVNGVSNSNVLGGREDEMKVIVDPQALAARQLTVQDLREALRLRNEDTSAGDIWEDKRRWVVRTLGRFESPQEVEDAIIARRDGQAVRVGDVARVELGFGKPGRFVRNFGEDAIAINVQRKTGANVVSTMEGLRAAREELVAGVLDRKGLQLEQVYDETEYIESSIGLVRQNILVGGSLTILVLLLFLRSFRSTLVLAISIPVSLIGCFLVLQILGRSLNVISLAGLAFAVGMLVDNAVVVLESVYRRWQEGERRRDASVQGTGEVWGAVVASTLTTLAVFVPVVFVQDEAGQLFRDIAIAISAAVGLSLVVSVIVIPVAAARLLPPVRPSDAPKPSRLRRALASPLTLLDKLAALFVGGVVGLNRVLQRFAPVQALAVLAIVLGALLLARSLVPKVEYLPTGNRNLVFGIVLPESGQNLEVLAGLGKTIERRLEPWWNVDADAGDVTVEGMGSYPPIRDFFYVAFGRSVFMGVRAQDPLRSGELVDLISKVGFGLPGTFIVAKQSSIFEQGLSAGRSVDLEIRGPRLEDLVALGREAIGRAAGVVPGAQLLPRPSLSLSNPELHVRPRHAVLSDLGVSVAELGYTVDALVDGAYAADYSYEGTEIDLVIEGAPERIRRTQDLGSLPVAVPGGRLVSLNAIADIRFDSGPEQINRSERQRSVAIEVSPPPEVPLEDAFDRLQEEVVEALRREGKLDDGVSITLTGTADKLGATWEALRFNILLALLITYLLMAALFESWVYPLIIILSVPLAAVGGLAALALLNQFVIQPLDVLTMLGFVILIGTSVNNAILIVHRALAGIAEGRAPGEAVLDSVRARIRPIFMTTITTVSGLIPLVLFPGAGSELYRGIGAVVLGGLLASTLFTLVLVPSLFHLALRSGAALKRLVGRAA